MKLKPQNADLAYSLDGYLWAISSLTTMKIQIRCLRNNTVVEIKPPLQIVDIGNGCEGYAPNLYIPDNTELTATMMLPTQALFFLHFNFCYNNISKFLVWYNYSFYQLTPEDKKGLKAKMIQLSPLPIEEFEKVLTLMDNKYPFVIPDKAILACLTNGGFILIIGTIVLLWLLIRHQKQLFTVIKSAPQILKLFGGDFTVLPRLLKNHQFLCQT